MQFAVRITSLLIILLAVGCASKPAQTVAPQIPPTPSAAYELPTVRPGEKISKRTGYSLVFDSKRKIATWVGYVLTTERLKNKAVSRKDDFRYDADLGSAKPTDYARSGYDRGHLVPAEDQRFSEQAMKDSFLMSNMAPQKPCFNRGIWKRLETKTRAWANKFKEIFIVTGPISADGDKALPRTQVSIPGRFFKVILERQNGHARAVGFIMPNECSDADLNQFTVPIPEVEKATGLKFFPGLPPEQVEMVQSGMTLDAI